MPNTESIPTGKIRTDGGTQPRAKINMETCLDYAEQMKSGDRFPPVEVYFDGQHYWLADGFHRYFAHRNAHPGEPIEAVVYQGTREDAQWHSYGVNKTHGLRRTNKDKERAVRAALVHPRSKGMSDAAIAEHVGVHRNTVLKARRQLQHTETDLHNLCKSDSSDDPSDQETSRSAVRPESEFRTGRDGRTINTARIGKRRSERKPQHGQTVKISPKARMPKLGHSRPNPMIPLQFSPNNPHTAAATLVREFSRQWVEKLVEELTQLLNQQGATS